MRPRSVQAREGREEPRPANLTGPIRLQEALFPSHELGHLNSGRPPLLAVRPLDPHSRVARTPFASSPALPPGAADHRSCCCCCCLLFVRAPSSTPRVATPTPTGALPATLSAPGHHVRRSSSRTARAGRSCLTYQTASHTGPCRPAPCATSLHHFVHLTTRHRVQLHMLHYHSSAH